MAFVTEENDPNAPQAPGASPMNQPPQTATGAGGASSLAPGAGSASVPNSTQAPPVQDLKAYLTANAPQAVGMGQTIANGLNQEYQTAAGDINSAQTAQQNAIQAGSTAPNADLVSKAAADPTQFVQNPQNITDFLAQENATYTGPSAESAQAPINAVNLPTPPDINQPGGVRQLVTGMETNPTAGMSNLDTLILQGNPDSMTPIQGAIPQFSNLAGLQTTASGAVGDSVQKAIADAAAAQAGVKTAFTGVGGVVPTFQSNVNQELADATGQTNAYNSAINKLIEQENGASSVMSGLRNAASTYNTGLGTSQTEQFGLPAIMKQMAQLGVGGFPADLYNEYQTAIQSVNGKNPLNVQGFSPTPSSVNAPNINQVATPQDIAKQNALESLLGSNYTPFFNADGQTPYTAPGAAPTIQSELDSILSNLQGQPISNYVGTQATRNPNGTYTWNPGPNPGLTSAENAIRDYLAGLA